MAVRVVTLPAPTSGTDWTYTVPAQWLPYLYGVTAELVTAAPATQYPDETVNNNPLVFGSMPGNWNLSGVGPFAGGLKDIAPNHSPSVGAASAFATAAVATFKLAPVSMDFWVNLDNVTMTNDRDMCSAALPSLSEFSWGWILDHLSPLGQVNLDGLNVTAAFVYASNVWARPGWHHVGFASDATKWNSYIDGVAGPTHTGNLPIASANTSIQVMVAVEGQEMAGSFGPLAIYSGTLPAASFANHAAAASSWAAYRTAVLADNPVGFWGLNTVALGPSRIVTLVITDGTRTVAQFPANFAATTAAGFIWSWQALGPGAAASTDGSINSVPIPEIAVDAGYTIGTKTLDLAGTDDWQNITLWFDDGTGPSGGGPGGPSDVGYFDALLVPGQPFGA